MYRKKLVYIRFFCPQFMCQIKWLKIKISIDESLKLNNNLLYTFIP